MVVVVVVVVVIASCRQAVCSDSSKRRSISGMDDAVDAVRTVAETAGKVWNQENVRRAAAAGRAVREAGQGEWVLSPVLSLITPGTSIVTQMLSFLPDLASVVVQVLATSVYLAGTGVTAVGSGLSFGSSAVEGLGRSLTTASYVLPNLVSLLVVVGLSLVLLFPGVYDWVTNAVASVGLTLAGHVTTAARGFMRDDSTLATLLDTTALFMRKLRQDFQI
ncbi:uncharacterized protein LOC127007013 isoform X2 [Eriocheir sinensis]|nr:uncharacterized protein LOC127007013 isoform X2 [Eriocheir sinensis]XP_050733462.1 uncharacterized protein LOC127007013 isoform X2 [Eriocheir sinensis]